MTSIEINGTNYPLKFGLAFMRDINKKYDKQAEGAGFGRDDRGLVYAMLNVIGDKSIETLITVIMAGAKSVTDNQLTESELVEWLENEDTDIDGLFKEIESFFERSNFCRIPLKVTRDIVKNVDSMETEETKAEA